MQTESVDYQAAVEIGVAAFCTGVEPPSDDEVWQRLTGAGVAPWLAQRLLVFLPMAFTRRLVPEVSFPDELITRGGRVSLSAAGDRGRPRPRAAGRIRGDRADRRAEQRVRGDQQRAVRRFGVAGPPARRGRPSRRPRTNPAW